MIGLLYVLGVKSQYYYLRGVGYNITWDCEQKKFLGSGLRMEREAAGANLCCHNLSHERLSSLAEVNLTSGSLPEILCEGTCNPCSARWSQFYTLRKASGCLQT